MSVNSLEEKVREPTVGRGVRGDAELPLGPEEASSGSGGSAGSGWALGRWDGSPGFMPPHLRRHPWGRPTARAQGLGEGVSSAQAVPAED